MEDTSGLLAQPSNDVSNIRMYNIRESLENEEEQQQDQQPLAFDVSHVIDHLGYGKFQRFLFVLCGIGWATDIGEVLVASFFVQSVSRQFGVTNEATKSFIASAPFVGMLCGAVVFGAMADRFGRRPAFALTCVVTGVAGLLCAASQSFEMFVFLRALVGFGLGGNLPIGEYR
jgi:putative MFS transporter